MSSTISSAGSFLSRPKTTRWLQEDCQYRMLEKTSRRVGMSWHRSWTFWVIVLLFDLESDSCCQTALLLDTMPPYSVQGPYVSLNFDDIITYRVYVKYWWLYGTLHKPPVAHMPRRYLAPSRQSHWWLYRSVPKLWNLVMSEEYSGYRLYLGMLKVTPGQAP